MNITDAELARLEELSEKATPKPWAEMNRGLYPMVYGPNGERVCRSVDSKNDTIYIAAACNAVPSLVAEVRALRRYSQMMRSGNKVVRDGLESENASLRGQVEALQKMVEWLSRECADGTNDCPYLTWYRDWIPPTRPEWCSCTDTEEGGFDCTEDAKECWLKAARDSIVEES